MRRKMWMHCSARQAALRAQQHTLASNCVRQRGRLSGRTRHVHVLTNHTFLGNAMRRGARGIRSWGVTAHGTRPCAPSSPRWRARPCGRRGRRCMTEGLTIREHALPPLAHVTAAAGTWHGRQAAMRVQPHAAAGLSAHRRPTHRNPRAISLLLPCHGSFGIAYHAPSSSAAPRCGPSKTTLGVTPPSLKVALILFAHFQKET